MPPMAVPIAITFRKTQRSYLRYGWLGVQQWLCKVNNYDSKQVIDATEEQRSQIVWQL
jgi:hypothetical protein